MPIMLIIRRIVEHLHDRQRATVIPPFISPIIFRGSRVQLANHSASCQGVSPEGHPPFTKQWRGTPLASRLQDGTQLLFFPPTHPTPFSLTISVTLVQLLSLFTYTSGGPPTHLTITLLSSPLPRDVEYIFSRHVPQ